MLKLGNRLVPVIRFSVHESIVPGTVIYTSYISSGLRIAHRSPPETDAPLSLGERAYYGIRELIVTLELAPGAPVSERELMERLGLGRTPVREALRTLAQEKLVEVYPRRGIVVSPVDVGDLALLSEARITLESFAARLAAERANADDREVALALLAELPASPTRATSGR